MERRKRLIRTWIFFSKNIAMKRRRMLESIIASENSEDLEKKIVIRDTYLTLGCE